MNYFTLCKNDPSDSSGGQGMETAIVRQQCGEIQKSMNSSEPDLEEKFRDRYTCRDADFVSYTSEDVPPPPIFEDWHPRRQSNVYPSPSARRGRFSQGVDRPYFAERPGMQNPKQLQIMRLQVRDFFERWLYLGDDEEVMRPVIRVADGLGHYHILSIASPNENAVQQLPALRSEMHPGGFLPRRQAGEGVGQQEAVFRASSLEKETIVVAVADLVRTQHYPLGSSVCPDAGMTITEDNQLLSLRYRRREGVVGHWWGIGADDGGEFGFPKRQAQVHQSVVDALWQTGQSSHNVAPDGKDDAGVQSLCFWMAAPEVVAGTHLQ
ncbi:hypothetical protein SprV_0401663500 [Sparganum proliferum]